jgi:hypothetical protein
LNAGFSKASPSHPAETIASFPGPEDLLDPPTNVLYRLIVGFKPRPYFGFVPTPHTGDDNTWGSTFGAHCAAEMVAAKGAVGKHVALIVRQSIRTGLAVIYIGWSYSDLPTRAVSARGGQAGSPLAEQETTPSARSTGPQ